jgi:pimeloyl-ACP methyl ester carboxylesterase
VLGYRAFPSPHDAIFIHGAGCTGLLWKQSLQFLSGPSKALAVDLPGHPAGEITCRSVGDYAESLRAFMAESGVRSPVLCGHSMGGAVALAVALGHPESVGGLILVSTGAKLGVDEKILGGLKDAPLKTIAEVISPWSFLSADVAAGKEARESLSLSNLPVFLNDYLACKGFDVRQDLGRITTKTLVVCGDRDRMTPPKWSHFLASGIAGSELSFVKDSGHMLPLEKPEPLGRVVQSFLSALSR